MPEDTNNVSLFTYSEGNQVICLCGMDQGQAMTVHDALDQDQTRRFETGEALSQCLDYYKKRGAFIPELQIQVNVKNKKSGLFEKSYPPIPGRVAVFLWRCLASRNEPALEILRAQLRKFIADQKAEVYRPFFEADSAKPIKL